MFHDSLAHTECILCCQLVAQCEVLWLSSTGLGIENKNSKFNHPSVMEQFLLVGNKRVCVWRMDETLGILERCSTEAQCAANM